MYFYLFIYFTYFYLFIFIYLLFIYFLFIYLFVYLLTNCLAWSRLCTNRGQLEFTSAQDVYSMQQQIPAKFQQGRLAFGRMATEKKPVVGLYYRGPWMEYGRHIFHSKFQIDAIDRYDFLLGKPRVNL